MSCRQILATRSLDASSLCSSRPARPTIKLPNDIHIDRRKVAGVLVEMRAQEGAQHLAIVGVGINVNQSSQDFPSELQGRAISLAMALGRQVDRQKFAAAVLRSLDRT